MVLRLSLAPVMPGCAKQLDVEPRLCWKIPMQQQHLDFHVVRPLESTRNASRPSHRPPGWTFLREVTLGKVGTICPLKACVDFVCGGGVIIRLITILWFPFGTDMESNCCGIELIIGHRSVVLQCVHLVGLLLYGIAPFPLPCSLLMVTQLQTANLDHIG